MNSEALICEICGQEARGNHYGAVACRACAAFFRRTGTSKVIKSCSRKKQCEFFKNGFFTCKFCRLQKCFAVGMSSENFQFDRDGYNKIKEIIQVDRKIPMTMDIFLGRSNFIIFCAPQTPESSEKFKKNFIDVQFLLDEALTVLHQGSESPLIARNSLGKMAFGFRKIQNEDHIFENLHKIPEFGKTETLAQWEYDILKMTKWLTYFDDFQKLEQSLQIKMIQGIWSIWKKLERLAAIAMCIRRKLTEETIRKMKNGTLLFHWNQMKIDMSWCSKYSLEELKLPRLRYVTGMESELKDKGIMSNVESYPLVLKPSEYLVLGTSYQVARLKQWEENQEIPYLSTLRKFISIPVKNRKK
ncbi:hypothetical protein B9Z55_021373 [Caenorhabditis nigoni]|uniref:Nuclear receptor domain-containing protein n=2 Tax=Caenorhabditis nigoni TaxID=1611254 RepID=A0A2G5TRN4_9PELO|nr:hypothetical protein B9Z55_021373 [Caenorhabditis nigoni]